MAITNYNDTGSAIKAWLNGFSTQFQGNQIEVIYGGDKDSILANNAEKKSYMIIHPLGIEAVTNYENAQVSGSKETIEIFYKTREKAASGEIVAYLASPFRFYMSQNGYGWRTATFINSENNDKNSFTINIEVQ